MSENVSSCRPGGVSEEGLRVRLDLISQDDSQVQCLSDPRKLMQVRVEFLLTFTKVLSTNVFAPEV
jgi:hypothetical protein